MCYSAENDIQVVRQQRDDLKQKLEDACKWWELTLDRAETAESELELANETVRLLREELETKNLSAMRIQERAETAEQDGYARGIEEAAKVLDSQELAWIDTLTGEPLSEEARANIENRAAEMGVLAYTIRALPLLPTDTASETTNDGWKSTIGAFDDNPLYEGISEAGRRIRKSDTAAKEEEETLDTGTTGGN